MNAYALTILLGIILWTVPAMAQTQELLRVIPADQYDFTTDNLGNAYLWRQDELIKYSSDGLMVQRFSDKKLGRITTVDATNPFKILVFYREQGIIRVLDNMLAPSGGLLRLNEAQYLSPWVITASYNNNLWIYDKRNQRLSRTDLNLVENYRVENLQGITGFEAEPVSMVEYGDWLYMQDASRGLLVFDIYGNYLKTMHFKDLKYFQPREDKLILVRDDGVSEYRLKFLSEEPVLVPENAVGKVRFEKERLFILTGDSLSIFKISR